MDKRKIIVISLLVLFVIGMSMSSVSASKTVKIGKYKCKLSNKDIKKIKKASPLIFGDASKFRKIFFINRKRTKQLSDFGC